MHTIILAFSLLLGIFIHTTTVASNLSVQDDPYQLIIKFKKSNQNTANKASLISQLSGIDISKLRSITGNIYTVTLDKEQVERLSMLQQRMPRATLQTIVENLSNSSLIDYAVPDIKMYALDVSFNDQWDLHSPPMGVDIENAWTITQGRETVRVAVVDSGVASPLHADLKKNMLPGYSFVKDSTDITDLSTSPHGTHVAGIVAAEGKIFGSAPGVRIVPIQVLDAQGQGSLSDVLSGVYWAAGMPVMDTPVNTFPAKVINLSLGAAGQRCDQAWLDLISQLSLRGISLVVAAGNENTVVSSSLPANCPDVISVAATTIQGKRARYSNYGDGVTLAAPGGEQRKGILPSGKIGIIDEENGILSTVADQGYAYYQGTSMASPRVAGIVGLIYSILPNATPAQIKQILIETASSFPTTSGSYSCTGRYSCGAGIVNAAQAVNKAMSLAQEPVG